MLNFFKGQKAFLPFIISIFLLGGAAHAQDVPDTKDVNAHSPNPASMSKKEKLARKKKVKQKELKEKAIEKGRSNHEKIQTKEVRKRMKKSKRTAAANNAHERKFFLKRWFHSRHKTKRR